MRKVVRVGLLTAAAILGAADPFNCSGRTGSVRPKNQADSLVGNGRADTIRGEAPRSASTPR